MLCGVELLQNLLRPRRVVDPQFRAPLLHHRMQPWDVGVVGHHVIISDVRLLRARHLDALGLRPTHQLHINQGLLVSVLPTSPHLLPRLRLPRQPERTHPERDTYRMHQPPFVVHAVSIAPLPHIRSMQCRNTSQTPHQISHISRQPLRRRTERDHSRRLVHCPIGVHQTLQQRQPPRGIHEHVGHRNRLLVRLLPHEPQRMQRLKDGRTTRSVRRADPVAIGATRGNQITVIICDDLRQPFHHLRLRCHHNGPLSERPITQQRSQQVGVHRIMATRVRKSHHRVCQRHTMAIGLPRLQTFPQHLLQGLHRPRLLVQSPSNPQVILRTPRGRSTLEGHLVNVLLPLGVHPLHRLH